MNEIKLNVTKRGEKGSGVIRRMRKSGFVPAVVYSRGTNIPVKIKKNDLIILKRNHFSENIIITMAVDAEAEPLLTLIKDVQFDPLTEEVIHLDFIKVSLKEKVSVKVPVEVIGEPAGIKEGGILEHVLWEITVECFPTDIPRSIPVNVAELKIGDAIHIRELTLPEKVKVLHDPKDVVVLVSAPQAEEEPVAATEEKVEPEVIKEKPKEEKEGETEKEKGKEKEKEKEKSKD